MKRSNKFIIRAVFVLAITGMIMITGVGQRIYVSYMADYPESWLLIKPGMKSQDARDILGEPSADGRGLKTLDRWRLNSGGAELHLDLWFEEGSLEDAIVSRVVMWKRFLGVDAAKTVVPPWP